MKTKIISGFLCLTVLTMLGSCDKWIDSSLNTDPNNPVKVSLDLILPSVQVGLAYQMGGDIGRFTGLFTQHYTGVNRQHLGIYIYLFTESDVDNLWGNAYAGYMKDMSDMITIAKANKSPYYQAIAETMMAYSLGTMTDLYGDIPYADCFKGAANLTPAYQSQQEIYITMQGLLDSALVHATASTSNFKPGGDDLIYGGSMPKWIKMITALKARYVLHLAKQNPVAYSAALAVLGTNSFAGNADDAQFMFGNKATENNPLFQFMDQRGDITIGDGLIGIMDTLDPRLPMYGEADDDGKVPVGSNPGPFYTSPNSPVPFITYSELKFIEAEAAFQTNDKPRAHAAYIEGIKASCAKVGVDAPSIDSFIKMPSVDPGEANLTLENIMTQKYIALYTQAESWTDWRRTGFPNLTPTSGTKIPRRFPYPLGERLTNKAQLDKVSKNAGIFGRVWWDKE
jgi:hypothetical protein